MNSRKEPIKDMIMEAISYNKVRNWVFDKLENSDMDVDELRANAIRKFGKDSEKHIERAMSELLD